MGLKVSLGILVCPECGGTLAYSGIEEIEIYDAQCVSCRKKWQVVKYPDGRREVREKTIS
jgi:uncharacterized protein YbaR (Trm112 family)